jgi:hypothetical protein
MKDECRGRLLVAHAGSCLLGTCLAALMASGATAGEAAPGAIKIGEEIVIAADGPGKQLRGSQSVACGKDAFLVVWREGRTDEGGKAHVYGARYSLAGKAIDARPIELAPATVGPQDRPRAAYSEGMFLVVWQDFSSNKDMDVLGVRLSADPSTGSGQAAVLDAKPIEIAAGARTQVLPEVASDGKTGWLVAWQGFQGQEDACRSFAAHVAPDGKVGKVSALDASPMPKVAWDGGRYLVFSGPRGAFSSTRAQKFNADGSLDGKSVSSGEAFAGTFFSMAPMPGKGWVFLAHRAPPDFWGWGGPGAMRCFGLLPDGSTDKSQKREQSYPKFGVLEPGWLDVCSGENVKPKYWPYGRSAVAWDGKQCLAVWTRYHFGGPQGMTLVNGDLMAGRIREGWELPDAKGPIPVAATDGDEQNPALASNGAGKLLCVYEKQPEDGKSNAVIAARLVTTWE